MNIYQIKITLKYTHPPVWRRIQVPADIRLGKLHRILQKTMGWYDSHLHAFRVGHETYGIPDREFPDDETINERHVCIDKVVAEGDRLIDEYDFGDAWQHELLIEQVLPAEKGRRYPVCLAGRRACPPEDCGGPPATNTCSRSCATGNTRNMKNCVDGPAGSSTPRNLISWQ